MKFLADHNCAHVQNRRLGITWLNGDFECKALRFVQSEKC